MNTTVNKESIQEEIIEDFSLLESSNDKYSYIIELGKDLEALDEQHLIDSNIIKGCQSKVWLIANFEDGKVFYKADSDSTLVKGLISLLVRVFSNKTPQEILHTEAYFVDQIGLKQMLSMNRSNGLAAMMKQMKFYAIAFAQK
jgi:cysteine desulfuration protein SufE